MHSIWKMFCFEPIRSPRCNPFRQYTGSDQLGPTTLSLASNFRLIAIDLIALERSNNAKAEA